MAELLTKRTYTFTGASVDGLPRRSLLKSPGKYVLRILGDGTSWALREIQTRESNVVWNRAEDRHEFKCAPDQSIRVELCKNHSSRSVEEVGHAVLRVEEWIPSSAGIPIGPRSTGPSAVTVRLLLEEKSRMNNLPVTDLATMQDALSTANARLQAIHTFGRFDKSEPVALVDGKKVPASNIVSACQPLLENLEWFMTMMNDVAEVHPYAKLAWTVMSAAYKLVRGQRDLDANIQELLETMNDVYAFVREAQEIQNVKDAPGKDKLRERTLCQMSSQTIDCGHFISSYARDRSFLTRLIKQTGSCTAQTVTEYQESFEKLKADFRAGSQLQLEIVTHRIVGIAQDISAKVDVLQIVYVDEAGYDSGKRCLAGTRKDLIQDLVEWAVDDDPATPRMLLLSGPAGTGKSTIAHTVAGMMNDMDQLGSVFCFQRNSGMTRKPASLLRNIARDLCRGRPAYQAALASSIGDDRDICGTEDIERQFDRFLRRPSTQLLVSGTILIVIDALDECGTPATRSRLLAMLHSRLGELSSSFRFLITCRPEPDIINKLARCPEVKLHPMPTLEMERTLATDIFCYIKNQLSSGSGQLPKGLDDRSCEQLRDRSEGLFQWAFVACDFIVGQQRVGSTPRMRFEKLMRTDQGGIALDNLYKTVLSTLLTDEEARQPFKISMGMLFAAAEPLSRRSLASLMGYLPPDADVDPRSLVEDTVLPLLGSLLGGVENENSPVRPLHSSFQDMLCDHQRAGEFYIGADGHHLRLAISTLGLLTNRLHFNMCGMESSYSLNHDIDGLATRVPPDLRYACAFWGYHLLTCEGDLGQERSRRLMGDLLSVLLQEKLLFWMEAGSTAGIVGAMSVCLDFAVRASLIRETELLPLARDAQRFVRQFSVAIRESAPHVYLSALAWIPSLAPLSHRYSGRCSHVPRVHRGALRQWPVVDRVLSGHRHWVASVTFSPDGKQLASCSDDKTIRIWDAETGAMVSEPLLGHEYSVNSVTFSPDGKRLASSSNDQTIRIWDAETGTMVGEPLLGHEDSVNWVTFSPDGKRLASCSRDKTIRMWDVETGAMVGEPLLGHEDSVHSVTFSPDRKRLASCSRDKTIRIWDAETGAMVGEPLLGHEDSVNSVTFSPDGKWLASSSRDQTIRIWDAETGTMVGEPLLGHEDWVNWVTCSPDGKQLASCSDDKTIRMWDAETRAMVGEPLLGHEDSVNWVTFSPDGKRLASCSRDKTIRIWDAETGAMVGEPLLGHEDSVNSVTFSPDGKWLASSFRDQTIRIWDAETGTMVGEPLLGHEDSVHLVTFSPDGKRLASCSDDKTIRMWDAETGAMVGEPLLGHEDSVNWVTFSPDGKRLASCSDDKAIRMWDAETGATVSEPLLGHEDSVHSVTFSPDGKRLASCSEDETIRIWDAETGAMVGEPLLGHEDWVTSVTFSPDGKRLASCSDDKTIRMWDVERGAMAVEPLLGHEDSANSVTFSPDGKRLASCSRDKTIRIWDADTGAMVGEPLLGHEESANSVMSSPDWNRLDSCSGDRTVSLSRMDGLSVTSPAGKAGSATVPQISRTATESLLSLSPHQEHQYPPNDPINSDYEFITWDYDSGWIQGNGIDILLWVPPEMMRRLYTPLCPLVIPGPTIHVDLSKFVHGTRWTECYTG